MSVAVELSDELVSFVRGQGAESGHSVAEQIEFNAKLVRAIHDHPDVPVAFLREAVEAWMEDDFEPFDIDELK